MNRFPASSVLLLALLAWSGCSRTTSQDSATNRVLQGDQVRLLVPTLSKFAAVDDLRDFTLRVRPDHRARYHRSYFSLEAPRGCVNAEVMIAADWLGDDAVNPAWGFDFGPVGQEFLIPLHLTFEFDHHDLEGLDPALLTLLLDLENGSYEVIPSTVEEFLDLDEVVLEADVEHFSRYLIGVGPPPDDNGGGH